MHVFLDLRTLHRLPSASRAYLLALLDSIFPALREGDALTVLKLAGEPLPIRLIEHERIRYQEMQYKARRRRGRKELNALVQALEPDFYWSADPYVRFPVTSRGGKLRNVLSLESLPPFIDMAEASWRERLKWLWRAHPQLQAADALLCPNHALAVAYVAHLGLKTRRKTVVVPNGVHPIFRHHSEEEILNVRRTWLIPKRYVLMVGSSRNVDALEIPLKALARCEDVSPTTCVIIGDEALPEKLKEIIRDCHLEGMVRFLNESVLSLAELSAIYSGALVTLEPMQTADYRPTILRSMACGTPVICAAGALSKELYGNAILGVHPTDTSEWAKAYTALVLSTVLRERQIERGNKRVAENTWTATAKLSLHVLRAMYEQRVSGALSKVLE